MLKYLNIIVVSLFMVAFSVKVAIAEESQLELHTAQQTLAELKADGMISEQGYAELLALGVEADTDISVKLSRNLDTIRNQLQSGDDFNVQSSSVPEDGDEREHRWEREEDGDLYKYMRTERYFNSDGNNQWREVYSQRTYVNFDRDDGALPTEPE